MIRSSPVSTVLCAAATLAALALPVSAQRNVRQWWPLEDRGGDSLSRALIEGFEDAAAAATWSGHFGDDPAHRRDPASNYMRINKSGEPVEEGKRSLRVGPIPPVPPYTRGFGHYFLVRKTPIRRPGNLVNIGLHVHGTGHPSSIRLLYKSRGRKFWRTLEQDTGFQGWRWIAWPNVVNLGSRMMIAFDFINLSDRPLTWFIDGVAANHEIDSEPPGAPVDLKARAELLHVTLAWKPGSDPDLYGCWIFRSAGTGEDFPFLVPVRSGTTHYTDWDLPLEGGSFTYRVLAVDHSGRASAPSKPVTVSVPAFRRDAKLLDRLHRVVAAVIAERCGPRTRWGDRSDLKQWKDLSPEMNFRTWFQWGVYKTGWFPAPRLRSQPFKPFQQVVDTVRKDGGLFCAAVCCKYGSGRQVPLGPEKSMASYWTGFGTVRSRERVHAFRDNTRFSRGLDLTVAHAVARIDAGADLLWFDMQPYDPADQRTLRNRVKWEALLSHRKGLRDSPDILVGSDIYHQAFLYHPGRKDASCFDYRVEQGSKLFYENRDEAPYWGNSLFRNAAGRYLTHRDAGTAAHVDVSSTKINFCHGWLYYTGAGWTAGLYEKVRDVPVLCFIDWAQPTRDFMKVPSREQANFFRITAAEVIACGWKFCFPVQAWDYHARREGTVPVIRRLVHFYRRWAALYRDREIRWTEEPTAQKRAHSFPHCLTVKIGIAGGGGVMRNAGNAGLSYIVNDQPQHTRRLVHLFNHNFADYEVVAQKDVELTIPVASPVKQVYLVSPDRANPAEKKRLAFETHGDAIRCKVDIEYYDVIVLEGKKAR